MKKCDLCKWSKPNGKCKWHTQCSRLQHCEEAIKNVIKASSGKK